MNFSFLLRLAATRMRSRACDASARPCVRDVLCGIAFPSVPALRSTGSAAGMPVLFAGFTATSAESHFSRPFIVGMAPHLPDAIRQRKRPGWARDLPVPGQRASAHARVSDRAELSEHSRCRVPPCLLPSGLKRRRPG